MFDSCDPVDCTLPGFSLHGIFQARVLEWVAISFHRSPSHPEIKPSSPALAARLSTAEPPGDPQGCNMLCCVRAVLNCFSHVQLFVTLWTVAARLFCSWDSPGKNARAGCHALLPGIFLTQGSDPCHLLMSPACTGRWVPYHWRPLGSPAWSQIAYHSL